MLLIPWCHVSDWFETTDEERRDLSSLADEARAYMRDRKPDGLNLGVNVGRAAGQTVFHVHLHLIPRYEGDVAKPRGGVRGVIPGKQNY